MSVLGWLLDGDPSIRWQVLRDLGDASAEAVATERARVATEGQGAALLARQQTDGRWGGEPGDPSTDSFTDNPEWSCFLALVSLRDMGLDPASAEARRAVTLVADHVTWHWWDDRPFFEGEVEPCINGRVVAVGAYFGQDASRLVDRLLGEQMDDGGWNCEQENGSTRGSFHTTINVLEGLLEFERAIGRSPEVAAARRRGEDYLLERRLLRRRSTGEIIDPSFTKPRFPTGYRYDVLRALDHLRAAGLAPDERTVEAIDVVVRSRGDDGRWPLDDPIQHDLALGLGEQDGEPSRWITHRALRVLRWADAGTGPGTLGST
jgi:hypothetical protein